MIRAYSQSLQRTICSCTRHDALRSLGSSTTYSAIGPPVPCSDGFRFRPTKLRLGVIAMWASVNDVPVAIYGAVQRCELLFAQVHFYPAERAGQQLVSRAHPSTSIPSSRSSSASGKHGLSGQCVLSLPSYSHLEQSACMVQRS